MAIPKSKKKDLEIVRYAWRNGFPSHKVDPEAAALELNQIKTEKGALNANIVAATVTKRSVLAPLLEFDPKKALAHLRTMQAQDILSAMRVVVSHQDEEYEVPYLYPIQLLREDDATDEEPEPRTYLPITIVRESEDASAQVLTAARRELESWQSRYQNLVAVLGIQRALPQVSRAIRILKKNEGDGIQPQA